MARLKKEQSVDDLIAKYAAMSATDDHSEGTVAVAAAQKLAAMAIASTVGAFVMSPYAFADVAESGNETTPPAIQVAADPEAEDALAEAIAVTQDASEEMPDAVSAPVYVLFDRPTNPDFVTLSATNYALTFQWGLNGAKLIQKGCEEGAVIEWPTKAEVAVAGYELVGWRLGSDFTDDNLVATGDGEPPAGMSAAVMPAASTTYRAVYRPVVSKCDVTVSVIVPQGALQPDGKAFPSDGTLPSGKPASTTVQVESGQKLAASDIPEVPEILGYEFDGWYQKDTATGQSQKVTPTDVAVTKNTTFEARYTEVGTAKVEFVWGKGVAESGSTEAVSRWNTTLTKGHKLTATLPNATIGDGKDWKFLGWFDKSGKIFNANAAVQADQVYTARYEYVGPTTPVGPVDPNPIDPVTPDPIDPDPIVPDPGDIVKPDPVVSDNGVLPIEADGPNIPSPETPWNPPGLALAAGFVVPESGAGVVVLDELGQPVLPAAEAGAGDGDGDGLEDGASVFDIREEGGVALDGGGLLSVMALAGGTVAGALLATRAASLFVGAGGAAGAAVAASTASGGRGRSGRGRRLRKQQPAT